MLLAELSWILSCLYTEVFLSSFPLSSVYTMQLMLEIKKHILQRLGHDKNKELNYTEMGRYSLGTVGAWLVNITVVCCNMGVCAGYMIFISSNLEVSDQSVVLEGL